MSASRSRGLVAATLLLAGLAGVAGFLAYGGRHRIFSSVIETPVPAQHDRLLLLLDGVASPRGDFPPERFHEQVDGAAEFLLSIGATRILVWDLPSPAGATLEVFAFRDEQGAKRALTQDAGEERTSGAGDEAWAGSDSVLFRRGRYYARLSAPGIEEEVDQAALASVAERVDGKLRELTPSTGSGS